MNPLHEAYRALRKNAKRIISPTAAGGKAGDQGRSAKTLIASLPDPFRSALISMYEGKPQLGIDGAPHDLDANTRISPQQGMWIYEFCLKQQPQRTLEIGLAYGFSLLYILAAHKAFGGMHMAIDPFQNRAWNGQALQKVRQTGMSDSFQFMEDFSSQAVPTLKAQGQEFDMIFIDGNHRFDDVLVDFTLCDLICKQGGHLIFDDMWMPSIKKVAAFIDRNRPDYVKVETPVLNIAVYHRVSQDQREWSHFVDF